MGGVIMTMEDFKLEPIIVDNLPHKIEQAIRLIRSIPAEEVEVAYSGGKDSDVILELVRMSGVKHKVVYKNTTIDPPGTIVHVKSVGGVILQPKRSFLQIIEKKGLPNRFRRFCCSEFKEYYTSDYVVLGIRASERCESYAKGAECEDKTNCPIFALYLVASKKKDAKRPHTWNTPPPPRPEGCDPY